MTPDDLARLRRVAERSFARETEPWRQAGWSSRWQQELAFELALDVVPPGAGPDTFLLDVGCGLGDLFGHLRAHGRRVRYLGIDVLPEIVARARARWPDARFEEADVMDIAPPGTGGDPDEPGPDYVLAVGALGVRLDDAAAPVAFVKHCARLARRAAAITFPTTSAQRRATGAQGTIDGAYHDPVALHGAAREAAAFVSLREEIPPSEAVLSLQHGVPAEVARLARRVAIERGEPLGHEAAGALLMDAELLEESAAELAQAPETAANLALRGQAALLGGDAATAEPLFRRSLELGDRPEAHLGAALAAAMQDRLAEGAAALAAGAALHPRHPELWTKLVLLLLDLGRPEEARAAAARLEPDEPARAAYLNALVDLGERRHAAARASLERAIALSPDYVAALATLAGLCEAGGDARAAVTHWRAVLALRPDHPEAAASLTRLGGTLQ